MEPYVYRAKIIDVYDGDTCTAIVDLGFYVHIQMKLRLYGLDTPEVRGVEKVKGVQVRDIVRSRILNKDVIIKTFKDSQEKYGRYLAIIIYDLGTTNTNLNEQLLTEGNAVPMLY